MVTFEDAIRRSIKKFYDGMDPTETDKAREREITREFLDEVEADVLNPTTEDDEGGAPKPVSKREMSAASKAGKSRAKTPADNLDDSRKGRG